MMNESVKITGTQMNYYIICIRKLWLFSKGLSMEETSNRVLEGKVLHEHGHNREKNKEILIDDFLKVDILTSEYVKEIKMSSRMEEASLAQLYYYLYYLKQKGIEKKGVIYYAKERKREMVSLNADDERYIEDLLIKIERVLKAAKAPKIIDKPYCRKCAYFGFCFIGEE